MRADDPGDTHHKDVMNGFIHNLKKFYDAKKIKTFKVVVNAGNGCAGLALDAIEPELPVEYD